MKLVFFMSTVIPPAAGLPLAGWVVVVELPPPLELLALFFLLLPQPAAPIATMARAVAVSVANRVIVCVPPIVGRATVYRVLAAALTAIGLGGAVPAQAS